MTNLIPDLFSLGKFVPSKLIFTNSGDEGYQRQMFRQFGGPGYRKQLDSHGILPNNLWIGELPVEEQQRLDEVELGCVGSKSTKP